MELRVVNGVLTSALVLVFSTQVLAAELRSQVELLFANSSKVAPSILDAAREQRSAINATGNEKKLVDYAFSLVLIQQQKLQEATQLLGELAKTSGSSLPIQRSLIWTQLIRKEYPQALVGIESLAGALAGDKSSTPTAEDRETARFIGVAIAFLEGPAATAQLERPLADAKARILESLSADLLPDFEKSFAATTSSAESLQNQLDIAKAELAKNQADAIQKQAGQIAKDKESLEKNQQSLDEKAAKREQEAQGEMEALKAKATELQKQYSDLMILATPLQAQITQAQTEINGLTQLVQQPDGSYQQQVTDRNRVSFLQGVISRSQIQLVPIQSQIAAVNVRANDLRNKQNELMRQHNNDSQKRTGEERELAKNKSKLERMEKQQAKAAPTGNDTKTRQLAARVATFSNYEPFPLDREKQRVLSALK